MKRILAAVIVLLGLILGIVLLYSFGTPQKGSAELAAATAGGSSGMPVEAVAQAGAPAGGSMADSIGEVAEDAVAPAPDPSSPLAIEIPGCRCHSDDPKIVKEHESYRMNQCAGCHAGAPTGQ